MAHSECKYYEYDDFNCVHYKCYPMFNFSDTPFPSNRLWIKLPNWEIAIKVSTFIPIMILGIVGNIILLNLILRNRNLKTPINLLIANMAAADLLTIVVCPIMFMFHDFYQNYQLGRYGCKIEGSLEGALLITGVLNLCAVSYDRLTAIVLPTEARLTVRGAKIVMLLTWLTGATLCIPLAIYRTYVERIWKDFVETYCKENTEVLPKFWHVITAIIVWFPLCVMVISYTAIFQKLDRYEKQILKREHPLSVSYKTKVARTLFFVVITFITLRVPFTVLVFMRNDRLIRKESVELGKSFEALWYAGHYLIFLNAAVNPMIYGFKNDNFRRAFNQTPIFPCCFKPKKINPKSEKVRTFVRIFHNGFKPRGPCADDRPSGLKLFFSSKEKSNLMACYGSKTTKSTNLRYFDENLKEKNYEIQEKKDISIVNIPHEHKSQTKSSNVIKSNLYI